ncbi:hypothetical protein V6N11_072206 [Hibiscus sabdariffa]|uniref:Histone-binding protein RBBP4-like N-terminal domain-containing protein n=1 Tax=Hibiscus sabdariffa TaxID=183260 RepID=A0ABR2U342_9ROSI
MKSGKKSQQQTSVDDKYTQWKSLVPVLYDWLANHNLVWSSLSCRWGPQLEQATYKNRQRLYLSEQASLFPSWGSFLVLMPAAFFSSFTQVLHTFQFNDEARSPFVKKYKTIIHPGEVNRIRELPQNSKIVATHTDSPDVLIWNVEAQPNCHVVLGATNSRPDLILTGHQDNAEFALAMCPTEPYVLSGGKDKLVVLWSIEDHIATSSGGSIIKKPGEGNDKADDGPSVGPRGIFCGPHEFCSVGDDSCLILWDARVGTSPAVKVEKAHDADIHCVDWNPHDDNLILTGSADNTGHKEAVLCVQWSPDKSSVFGSSAEDGLLNIWDYDKV